MQLTTNFKNIDLNKKYGLIFFILIVFKYSIEYFLWGNFFVRTHDNLDSDIVYNNAIGNFYSSGLDISAVEVFLNGNIKWNYFIKALQPMIFFYVIFTAEIAYFITEILVICLAYISMLSYLRYDEESIKQAHLFAIFFAFSLSYTTYGLGVACFPYVLSVLRQDSRKIGAKSLCLLAFIGANSLLAMHVIFYPILIYFSRKICNVKLGYQKTVLVLVVSMGGSVIAASGLIYAQFFSEPSHRTLWASSSQENIIGSLKFIALQSFTLSEYYHSYVTPIFYAVPLLIMGLISNNTQLKRNSLYLILFLFLTLALKVFGTDLSFFFGPLKSIQFDRIGLFSGVFLTIFAFNFYLLEKRGFLRAIATLILLSYFIYTLLCNTGIVENIKKNFISKISFEQKTELKAYLKESEYTKFLERGYIFSVGVDWKEITPITFSSYYRTQAYSCIKSITKENRVMSVGIDPMIAAFNGLPVIDGYHNFYPAFYKAEFRKIISKQIEGSDKSEYFDGWGSRVYTFVDSPANIKLNYIEALQLGAKYAISLFPLSSENLIAVSMPCNAGDLYLYRIQ